MSQSRDLVVVAEKGRALRWGLRLSLVVFGTAMGLVVASEPVVRNAVTSSVASLTQQAAPGAARGDKPTDRTVRPVVREVKAHQPILSQERFENLTSDLPRVGILPQSRVNVIRLTP